MVEMSYLSALHELKREEYRYWPDMEGLLILVEWSCAQIKHVGHKSPLIKSI